MMENKARDAEMMVTRLVEEAERRREEADVLKKEVENARLVLGRVFSVSLYLFYNLLSSFFLSLHLFLLSLL